MSRPAFLCSFLNLTLIICLSACGSKSDDNYEKRFGTLEAAIGDCTYSPYQGEEFSSEVLNSQITDSGYYNKRFNRDAFEESLNTSSISLVEALHQKQVEVYKVSRKSESTCQYFNFLHEAPEPYQNAWNQNFLMSQGSGDLLGLFSTNYSEEGSSALVNPTILLNINTSKWTLVHEFTHYLFAKARASEGKVASRKELKNRVANLNKNIRRLKRLFRQKPSRDLAKQLLETHEQLFTASLRYSKRKELEEVVVESLILDAVDQGLLTEYSENDYQSAANYLNENAKSIKFDFRKILRSTQRLNLQRWPRLADRNELLISKVKNFLRSVSEHTTRYISN